MSSWKGKVLTFLIVWHYCHMQSAVTCSNCTPFTRSLLLNTWEETIPAQKCNLSQTYKVGVTKWPEVTVAIISAQNSDVPPVPPPPPHDKDCTAAAKWASWCHGISRRQWLVSRKLLLPGYSVNKDLQFLIGQCQSGIELIWGNLPTLCNNFHHYIIIVLKLCLCSFLNH